jgi:hypothetical protein
VLLVQGFCCATERSGTVCGPDHTLANDSCCVCGALLDCILYCDSACSVDVLFCSSSTHTAATDSYFYDVLCYAGAPVLAPTSPATAVVVAGAVTVLVLTLD